MIRVMEDTDYSYSMDEVEDFVETASYKKYYTNDEMIDTFENVKKLIAEFRKDNSDDGEEILKEYLTEVLPKNMDYDLTLKEVYPYFADAKFKDIKSAIVDILAQVFCTNHTEDDEDAVVNKAYAFIQFISNIFNEGVCEKVLKDLNSYVVDDETADRINNWSFD